MLLHTNTSRQLFEQAKKHIAGGVNSPARAFKAVGGQPLFISHGKGSRIVDVDNNEFIDYVCSWGPLILGHCNEEVLAAVEDALQRGTTFGAPTEIETKLAELICSAFPSVESVRMVNSGTEAVMGALRLARGVTKRKKFVKFIGCYHGHVDALLVKAGSGLATLGTPDSAGVSADVVENTICIPYNNSEAAKETFDKYGEEIAAVIVEPIAGNMGAVKPQIEFLRSLRALCTSYGSILIFDEVITGFRVEYGGVQTLFNIQPDMTILGKIIGGGFPVGAYGGRKEIMQHLAPDGDVYQAGTLSGNPIAMTAGYATLKILQNKTIYAALEEKGAKLENAVKHSAQNYKLPVQINRIGSMFTIFFTDTEVIDYASASQSNTDIFRKYFHFLLEQGIYVPPSQFEANFISSAHSDEDIEKTSTVIENAFANL